MGDCKRMLSSRCRKRIRSAVAQRITRRNGTRSFIIKVRNEEESRAMQMFLLYSIGARWCNSGKQYIALSFRDAFVGAYCARGIRIGADRALSVAFSFTGYAANNIIQAELASSNFIDE